MERIEQKNQKPEKLVYTVKEVADILGISLRTAYNLCSATSDFKVLRVSSKSVRVHKQSFDQWFSSL